MALQRKLPPQKCPYCGEVGNHNPYEAPHGRVITVTFVCSACNKLWQKTFSKNYEDSF